MHRWRARGPVLVRVSEIQRDYENYELRKVIQTLGRSRSGSSVAGGGGLRRPEMVWKVNSSHLLHSPLCKDQMHHDG